MTIEDDIKFLERVPLLRLVGRAGLRIIAIGAEQRYVHGGEILFHKNMRMRIPAMSCRKAHSI